MRSVDGVGDAAFQTRSRRRAGTTAQARTMRQAGNDAEALIWTELKRRKLGGYKFTRQFPIGTYFADFCCRERRLVVEIDGSQHAGSRRDGDRDNFMQAQGYSVLRFWTIDALKHRPAVLETILAALEGRLDATRAPDLRFLPALTTA